MGANKQPSWEGLEFKSPRFQATNLLEGSIFRGFLRTLHKTVSMRVCNTPAARAAKPSAPSQISVKNISSDASADKQLPSSPVDPTRCVPFIPTTTVSPSEITAFALTLLIMLVGWAGALLPGLPGTPLIALAALGHRWILGDNGAATWVLITLIVVAVFSAALDFAAASYGAQRLGATWRGMVGAAIGGLLGLWWPPLGWIAGPLLGAILGEWIGGRPWSEAGSAGVGAALGLIAGTAVKVASASGMILLWAVHVLWKALNAA